MNFKLGPSKKASGLTIFNLANHNKTLILSVTIVLYRYGLLNQNLFNNLNDVEDYATRWLWFYNHERPHQANGGKPPLMNI